jgi:hypothetical protein
MSGLSQTRGIQLCSQSASSCGISHASRLSSVQRTFSNGNADSAHSARRYGVYEVEMMKVGMSARIASSVSRALGTTRTCSALNSSTSSSVTWKARKNGGIRRSVSPAL